MKKILVTLLAINLASCYYTDRNLNLNIENSANKSINDVVIKVSVTDLRPSTTLVGKKEIGDNSVNLNAKNQISELLQTQISQAFNKNNYLEKRSDHSKVKNLELFVEEFSYKAKRGFFVGRSSINGKIKAVIKDKNGKAVFTKNFEISQKNKHFIVPLDATDEATINQILGELVNDILTDQSLRDNLMK